MRRQAAKIKELHDLEPEGEALQEEVLAGLLAPQKRLPCKLFYDTRGSQLFEEICQLDEYYPTRTELGILDEHAAEMAALIGPGALVIEYGSGASMKTRWLLDHLDAPTAYVPIDISREFLLASAGELARAYPHVEILPVCGDYTSELSLPKPSAPAGRRLVYFPGSTIGNFTPEEAGAFLNRLARLSGPNGALLIGVDLRKDRAVLEAAYDDARGVTARFNLNILARINQELGGGFNLERFAHRAFFNEKAGRIEMHLESLSDQRVRVGGQRIRFAKGETICTEYSYKYQPREFQNLTHRAGWRTERVWTDSRDYFSVQYLTAR